MAVARIVIALIHIVLRVIVEAVEAGISLISISLLGLAAVGGIFVAVCSLGAFGLAHRHKKSE